MSARDDRLLLGADPAPTPFDWDRAIATLRNLDRIEREIADANLSMARDIRALIGEQAA